MTAWPDLPTRNIIWDNKESNVTSEPTIAPANTSVIDKLRASGMTDDQIINAIMGFGQSTQAPLPVPVNSNDVVATMRQQGYTDEQITATVVASAAAANVAGSGDPTAAGGVTVTPDDLDAHKTDVLDTVGKTLHDHSKEIDSAVQTVSDHSQRLRNVEAWIGEHGHALYRWFEEHRTALEEILQVGVTIATDVEATK